MNNIETKFASVKEVSKLYPSFSEGSLRYLLFHSKANGLASCIRRVGRKIIFNIPEFENWLNGQQGGNHHE